MGISNTTKIVCDYVDKEGKVCGKIFVLPDDPKKNTPGIEHTISTTNAHGQVLYFCTTLHMIAHWAAWLKATPQEEVKKPKLANAAGLHVVAPTAEQIESLAEAGVIEPAQDDLKLGDE